jgi:hypothetical protein
MAQRGFGPLDREDDRQGDQRNCGHPDRVPVGQPGYRTDATRMQDIPAREQRALAVPGYSASAWYPWAGTPRRELPWATGARQMTDPGRALIIGKWSDIGRFKGPILRALATSTQGE